MQPFGQQNVDTQYYPVSPQPPPADAHYSFASNYIASTLPLKSPYINQESITYSPPYIPKDQTGRRSLKWRLRNMTSNSWLWEMAAALISLLIAALICWELKKLDGMSTSNWYYAWSPTSSLALAVTIAKAAMMVPVASALGQLKWHWYKTPQKLDGVEHFDGASRGVIGSLRLLIKLRFWHLASVGALITVCTLSLDALTQNAVRLRYYSHLTHESFVYRTRKFEGVSTFRQRGRELPSSDMLPAVTYAISASEAPHFEQDLPSCLSNNCTFGQYDSLAVNYQCVTSKVNRTRDAYQHAGMIDNSFWLNSSTEIVVSNTTSVAPPAGTYPKPLGDLISRWLVLANPSTLKPAPIAIECAFYWAVNTYNSSVINGVFYENITAEYVNQTKRTSTTEDIYITPDQCWRDNKKLPKDAQNCTNVVRSGSHQSLQTWFNLKDVALRGSGLNTTLPTDKLQYWDYSSFFIQSLLSLLTEQNSTNMFHNIDYTANQLSTTMTTMLRQMPETFGPNDTQIKGMSNGTTEWTPDTLYEIHWRYLIFPMGIIGLSLLFFVMTVIFTWGEGGWKSSQLAVVLHGLSEPDSVAVGSVKDYTDMKELGKTMHVQLQETNTGRKLVSQGAITYT